MSDHLTAKTMPTAELPSTVQHFYRTCPTERKYPGPVDGNEPYELNKSVHIVRPQERAYSVEEVDGTISMAYFPVRRSYLDHNSKDISLLLILTMRWKGRAVR